jgi:hypothetical protein
MEEKFKIIELPEDASQTNEVLGSKPKFWYDNKKYLFKQTRQNTGEHWAEKISAELCFLLGLPYAQYDFATWRDLKGTASKNFLPEKASLIHGNEILQEKVKNYPSGDSSENFQKASQHTLDRVFDSISDERIKIPFHWDPPKGIEDAQDTFIGYLLLDTWIGNTDRHHQNWAVIALPPLNSSSSVNLYLAPTYDHSSSLGRNEPAERIIQRLTTKDKNYTVQAYVEKCRSAFYNNPGDAIALTTLEVFRRAAQSRRKAAKIWLDVLRKVSQDEVNSMFARIPEGWISEEAVQFAEEILRINQNRVLSLQEVLT